MELGRSINLSDVAVVNIVTETFAAKPRYRIAITGLYAECEVNVIGVV
jgi:hypothetical protein